MFWGDKKPEGKTVLLIDVENGSVGAALLRIDGEQKPRLYASSRKNISLLRSVSSGELLHKLVHATRETLAHTAMVAARMRGHFKYRPLGSISQVEVFLSPPWTTLETQQWQHEEAMVHQLAREITARFGHVPLTLHPWGRPLASVARGLYPDEEAMLVSSVSGEVTELFLLRDGLIAGRGTVPYGHHLLLRTLGSHAGMSEVEARSAMRLRHPPMREALQAAGNHFVEELKDVARQLLVPEARSVLVVSEEPVGEWFARAFSEHPALEELFPDGGTVRALRAHHLSPHLEAPSPKDLPLMLEALFVDAHSSSRRAAAL